MSIKTFLKRWVNDECGAITVDWVVLLAGIVTMIFLVFAAITPSTEAFAEEVGDGVESIEPGET